MNTQQTIIYVSYGTDQLYHSGVLFNWQRLIGLGYVKSVDNIIIYTDQPKFYDGYPVTVRKITPAEIADWTLDGRYHFRIKTKALIEATNLYGGKLLLIDSDRLINIPLNKIFDTISSNTCLFAANEGALGADYEEILNSEKNDFLKHHKDLTHVNMYCSALIGVSSSMLSAIKLADKLMIQWLPKTNAHTVEQFAISQALLREGNTIVSAAKWLDDFNSKGKKAHAKQRINSFFISTQDLSFDVKAQIAAKWDLRRSFIVWLKQKFKLI